MTIDVNRLMCIESNAARYRCELRMLAAGADLDSDVAAHLWNAAIKLQGVSWALASAVREAQKEETP